MYFSKLKAIILSALSIIDTPDGQIDFIELEKYESQKRGLITKDSNKNIEEVALEIDRNFISLCSLMEDNGSKQPEKYSVIQYYGKIDYISKKYKNGTGTES